MSPSKIKKIINDELKKDGSSKSIYKSKVSRILKAKYGKPRKIKRVFFLSNKKKKRASFFKKMIKEQRNMLKI